MEDESVNYLVESIRCKKLSWPITYVGIPLGGNSRSRTFWEGVGSKVARHLKTWKGNLFYFGGRVTLINICLSSIPFYFRIPAGITERIEARMRKLYEEEVIKSAETI